MPNPKIISEKLGAGARNFTDFEAQQPIDQSPKTHFGVGEGTAGGVEVGDGEGVGEGDGAGVGGVEVGEGEGDGMGDEVGEGEGDGDEVGDGDGSTGAAGGDGAGTGWGDWISFKPLVANSTRALFF
jgi:hypothetical protein